LNARAQYSNEVKALVKAKYPLCKTPADRDRLAEECGIGSRQKLYNLASRLLATRPHSGSENDWAIEEAGYDASQDLTRLYLRDDPDQLTWNADDRRYLSEHFGRTFIEDIAFFLNRTETAVAYEARRMGLRNVPKYYDAAKVAPWLGISMSNLLKFSRLGLDIFPCCDRYGKLKITLISTTSLARFLLRDRLWRNLVDRYDADLFFIRDVIESAVELQKGNTVWEPDPWVSHGHTCLNPFADLSFGWFYHGRERAMDGLEELDPRDLAPGANVTSDDWRRGEHGKGNFEKELEQLLPNRHRAEEPEEEALETS
jgi:hypothetical protein